jgi:major membrane immunogen (membrane-anchored lipoprotein)
MVIKHVLAGATVVATGVLVSACDWGDFTDNKFSDQETLDQPVSEVRFANDSGDVTIRVGDSFEVRREVGYNDRKPGKTYRMDGDALVLEDCSERDCWVSYDVTVPEGTTVSGALESGNVEVVGVASANVAAQSGEVTVRDVAGEVNATTESGNVELSGIGGTVVAGAQSGNVTVAMTSAKGVTATTESGNVDVTVPNADYKVDIRAEDVTDEVGDDGTGPTISLGTESGNVTLRPV